MLVFLAEDGGIGLSTFFRSNFQACQELAFQLLPLGIFGGQGQEKANMETLADKPAQQQSWGLSGYSLVHQHGGVSFSLGWLRVSDVQRKL